MKKSEWFWDWIARWYDKKAQVDEAHTRAVERFAKYLAAEASLMATSRALQTIGGRSAHKYYPLERLFRDVRTCSLMPPNVDRSLEIIGKAEMEIEDALLRQRHVS